MNDWSVIYIEKDVIDNIESKTIIQWFKNMKTCKMKNFIFYVFTFFFQQCQYIQVLFLLFKKIFKFKFYFY